LKLHISRSHADDSSSFSQSGHPRMISVSAFTGRVALTDSQPELAAMSRHRTRELGARTTRSRFGRTIGLTFGAVSALLLVGCSKSHDLPGTGLLDLDAAVDDISPDASTAGRGGTSGRAGSSAAGRGGTSGRAGSSSAGRGGSSGRTGGAAGTGAAGRSSTSCNACADPGLLAGLIQATSCCTTSDACGLTAPTVGIADCLPLDAPGAENAACPAVSIAGLLDLAGCCTADGTCGALDTLVGLGCAKVSTGAVVNCSP
jgi:hypothetical protein